MADTLPLGGSAARHGGSSPLPPIKQNHREVIFVWVEKGASQLLGSREKLEARSVARVSRSEGERREGGPDKISVRKFMAGQVLSRPSNSFID